MSDNPILDVAIGLVFVYVLYSLLASTLKEFLSSFYSYRGRMLERGIEQMLDGQNWGYYWWNKLYNWMVWLKNKSKLEMGKRDFMSNKQLTSFHPSIKRARLDRKSALYAAKVFNHPLYKRLSAGNKLNSKPAYVPADVFSKIIIDLLNGQSNGPILMKNVSAGIHKTDCGLRHETQKVLDLYTRQANGDLQSFQRQVENWYNDTMDRVSGWYKKQASYILLVIGLLLSVIFNVSTIDIVTKLSKDKTARNAAVQSATAYVQQHSKDFNNKIEVTANNSDPAYNQTSATVTKIRNLYDHDISQQNATFGLGWGDFGFTADSVDAVKHKKPKPKHKDWVGKTEFVLISSVVPHKLIGFLLTAFAISLGAPFWFDLLNKLVNLRNAGKKPDDNSSGPAATAGNGKPLPNSFS